jgi:fermentation-respiration switch protein FrsA (DUF1100 family)
MPYGLTDFITCQSARPPTHARREPGCRDWSRPEPAPGTPLLVLHGDRDDIVPLAQGRALFEAAPEPNRMHLFPGLGHNDLVLLGGVEFARVIASWTRRLQRPSTGG